MIKCTFHRNCDQPPLPRTFVYINHFNHKISTSVINFQTINNTAVNNDTRLSTHVAYMYLNCYKSQIRSCGLHVSVSYTGDTASDLEGFMGEDTSSDIPLSQPQFKYATCVDNLMSLLTAVLLTARKLITLVLILWLQRIIQTKVLGGLIWRHKSGQIKVDRFQIG